MQNQWFKKEYQLQNKFELYVIIDAIIDDYNKDENREDEDRWLQKNSPMSSTGHSTPIFHNYHKSRV